MFSLYFIVLSLGTIILFGCCLAISIFGNNFCLSIASQSQIALVHHTLFREVKMSDYDDDFMAEDEDYDLEYSEDSNRCGMCFFAKFSI